MNNKAKWFRCKTTAVQAYGTRTFRVDHVIAVDEVPLQEQSRLVHLVNGQSFQVTGDDVASLEDLLWGPPPILAF